MHDDIKRARDGLLELKKNYPLNMEIKETLWLMTWSGMVIDPETDNSLLQIENYLYNYNMSNNSNVLSHLDYRPNIILDKSSNELFDAYYKSIKNMWDAEETKDIV